MAEEIGKGRIFGEESKYCKVGSKIRVFNIKSSKKIVKKKLRIPEIRMVDGL